MFFADLEDFSINRDLAFGLIVKNSVPKNQREVRVHIRSFLVPPFLKTALNIPQTSRFWNYLKWE